MGVYREGSDWVEDKDNMAEEVIIAWKVGGDDDGIKNPDSQKTENDEGSDYIPIPAGELMSREEEEDGRNPLEIHETEPFRRVNSTASYGSVGSFDSFAADDLKDEKDSKLSRRRSKKASVCSNMSTISISSEQPYVALMSNLSRDRKLSSLSSDSYCDTRHSSFGSSMTRKISEGAPAFISMMSKSDQTPEFSLVNENIREQRWLAKNHIYGKGKKIQMKNFHGKDRIRRGGEIFPGYEKTIQERVNNVEETEADNNEDGENKVGIDQKGSCMNLEPKDPGSRRGSLNSKTILPINIADNCHILDGNLGRRLTIAYWLLFPSSLLFLLLLFLVFPWYH